MARSLLFALYIFLLSNGQAQNIDSLRIGSGGGITGRISLFNITQGKVLKGSGLANIVYTDCIKLTKKQAKEILSGAKKISLRYNDFNQPYNNYCFLEIYSGTKTQKFIWGKPDFIVPKQLLDFYTNTNNLCNKKFNQ